MFLPGVLLDNCLRTSCRGDCRGCVDTLDHVRGRLYVSSSQNEAGLRSALVKSQAINSL